jgi:Autophagy protein ATG9
MFNHKYQIRPAFYLDPAALQRRFMLCGIAHAIFMPFLLFFITLHFGLQNAYDWRSRKQYLGPREWSLSAKWTFREFNELPHIFERRLGPSYEAAEEYVKLFGQNEVVVALGRILVFIGGSLGAVLFAFAALNDAILLHVKIADWNLLWYAGVIGVVYSVGKGMLPTTAAQPRSSRNLFAEIDAALANVATYSHHYPDVWRGRGWEKSTYKAFSSMFRYKAQMFLSEAASVIVAPYILCVSLARCAEPICEFVLATRPKSQGSGRCVATQHLTSTFTAMSFGKGELLVQKRLWRDRLQKAFYGPEVSMRPSGAFQGQGRGTGRWRRVSSALRYVSAVRRCSRSRLF